MDIREHNRSAWDRLVQQGNKWTVPVSTDLINRARKGEWEIVLTPQKTVPKDWFPDIGGLDVLCLASGGGQQGPILAAAGANVTVFDNSPRQLERDRYVADRDSLILKTVEGDMADLAVFDDESFDLIVHPVSNTFVPDVRPVWTEAYRVLRHSGVLLSGFNNPAVFLFDYELLESTGTIQVKFKLPYSDVDIPEEKKKRIEEGEPFEFSHTLEELIGGQIDTGFIITGFYEDAQKGTEELLAAYMPTCIATRAIKP
jgi:SAM-dependent methyltransferase